MRIYFRESEMQAILAPPTRKRDKEKRIRTDPDHFSGGTTLKKFFACGLIP